MRRTPLAIAATVLMLAIAAVFWLLAGTAVVGLKSSEPEPPQQAKQLDPTPAGELRGRVVDDSGNGVGRALVHLDDIAKKTDGFGLFAIPAALGSAVEVQVVADGLLFARRAGRCCALVDITKSVRGGLLTLGVHRPATVEGVVVASGRPVPGATISAHYEFARGLTGQVRNLATSDRGQADTHGRFRLSGMFAGRVRLLARLGDRVAVGEFVLLPPGARRAGYVLQMQAVAALNGLVRSRDGVPVPGADVRLGDGGLSWNARTGPRGRFRIAAVPAGTWPLVVSAAGFAPHFDQAIAMHPHAEVSRTISLEPILGVVGRVMDTAGDPVVGATVVFGRPGEHRLARAGLGGRFSIAHTDMPSGPVLMTAIDPSYAPSPTLSVSAGEQVELRLGAGGRLHGIVVDAADRPVPSANVSIIARSVDPPDPGGVPSGRNATSGADGTFDLKALRPGKYDLFATAGDRPPAIARDVQVIRGGDATVRLVTNAGVTLRGQVTGDDGSLVAHAEVTTWPAAGSAVRGRSAACDDDARFELRNLPPGQLRLRVAAKGWLPEVIVVSLPDAGEVAHDISLRAVSAAQTVAVASIGLSLTESTGGYVVVDASGAAAAAGVGKGERIVGIDFQNTDSLRPNEAENAIRAGLSTQLTLEVIGPDGARRSVYVTP